MSDLSIILERIDDCNKISSHCKKHDLVIQAGSHYGFYPQRLASIFKKVITFEADIDNFNKCNIIKDNNIKSYHAILGDKIGYRGIERINGHDARSYVIDDGDIPVVTIDSLDINQCDLIYLDIEGYELKALLGALKTINKFKPVIAVEQKKLIRTHGYGCVGDHEKFFESIGYYKAHKYHIDVVYMPICENS